MLFLVFGCGTTVHNHYCDERLVAARTSVTSQSNPPSPVASQSNPSVLQPSTPPPPPNSASLSPPEQTYTPPPPVPTYTQPPPSCGKDTKSCRDMYEIYEKCYSAGIGKTSKFCSNLAVKIYESIDIQDTEMKKTLSLYCGVSCNEAAKNQEKESYCTFSRKRCKK
ncbi:hypothetical protein TI05_09230 [Achromatium sp. WMS3]|nr:hypothetical protein TI05_09230 [Achromatium sp. WMS3]